MNRISGWMCVASLTVGLLLAGGCTQKSQPAIRSDVLSGSGVTVNPPVLSYESGLLSVTGSVHADQASNYDIPGRIRVEIVGSAGEISSHWWIRLVPVPADPARLQTYGPVLFDVHPTRDQTVRVHFVDEASAVREIQLEKSKAASEGVGQGL